METAKVIQGPQGKEITKVIHINPQSKGSLGKSFWYELFIAWCEAHNIPWVGYDLDDRHQTLHRRHPLQTKLCNIDAEGSLDTFAELISGVFAANEPVVVIDTRAQADQLVLEALSHFRVFERAEEVGARVVLSLFPSDDRESLLNLQVIVRQTARKADYLLVRNKARAKAKAFNQSDLRKTLLEKLGAVEIRVNGLSAYTIAALEQAEKRLNRGIGFAEFAGEMPKENATLTGEMATLLHDMSLQFYAIAKRLVPPSQLAKLPAQVKESAKADDSDLDLDV
jgi:hypothetical protein